MKNKENNNGEWMRVLCDKVDAAQTPTQHDADDFEALMARMAASASPHAASAERPGRTLRRVAVLTAAAMLAAVAVLGLRPDAIEDASYDTLADKTTVTGAPHSLPTITPTPEAGKPLPANDPLPSSSRLLTVATPQHTAGAAALQAKDESATPSAPSATSAPLSEAAATQPDNVPETTTQEESSPSSFSGNPGHPSSLTPHPSPLIPHPSPEGVRVSLYASGGADGVATVRPTFTYPYASGGAEGPLAAPANRLSGYPGLSSALTHYDYDACTFVHHTPLRIKALAQCDLWSPIDGLTLSAGGGLMYTELTSTVYPLFINTAYTQRLRMIGIPIEANVSWLIGKRWNVFAGIGLTGQYCYHARLDTQDQPERPFHFGAYGQAGIGMRVTDDLQLGVAAEYTYAFTHTVLNTLLNSRTGAVGLGVSLTYIIPDF